MDSIGFVSPVIMIYRFGISTSLRGFIGLNLATKKIKLQIIEIGIGT